MKVKGILLWCPPILQMRRRRLKSTAPHSQVTWSTGLSQVRNSLPISLSKSSGKSTFKPITILHSATLGGDWFLCFLVKKTSIISLLTHHPLLVMNEFKTGKFALEARSESAWIKVFNDKQGNRRAVFGIHEWFVRPAKDVCLNKPVALYRERSVIYWCIAFQLQILASSLCTQLSNKAARLLQRYVLCYRSIVQTTITKYRDALA